MEIEKRIQSSVEVQEECLKKENQNNKGKFRENKLREDGRWVFRGINTHPPSTATIHVVQ